MIVIKENKNSNEISYEFQIKNGKYIILTQSLHHRSFIKNYNGKEYIVLYNPEMQPISEVFGFLNNYKIEQSINTKTKDLQALKLLFTFERIININLVDFTGMHIDSLKKFISGLSIKGNDITYELITQRSPKTVDEYLAVYRKYLDYLGLKNTRLNEKREIRTKLTYGDDMEFQYAKQCYTSNERIPKKVIEVPRYISVKEFEMIIGEIRKHYSKRDEIIVRLMFQLGLRIGEVLGLTGDDVTIEKLEDPTNLDNSIFAPVVFIRNRVSDKKYQKAKRLMNVIDRKQYKTTPYKTSSWGYDKIVLPKDLCDLINDYIEEEHTKYLEKDYTKIKNEKKLNSYYKHTIADRVSKPVPYELPNYYIFINSLGTPLSQSLWNGVNRKIFQTLGIEVDRDVKEHNLNHRYRHGFSMFHVQYRGTKILELKKLMRHTSIQSTAKYYRPTTEDAIKIKNEFTAELYKTIPELERKE